MGLVQSLICTKRKKIKISKSKIDITNVNDDSNVVFEKPLPVNQYLIYNELSSSEVNLLIQLREGGENFKRPKGVSFPKYVQNKPIIRIASWNLHNMTTEKLKNPGILSVICLTILENSFSIITLQEVNDKEVADMICKELNHPTLTKIKSQTNSNNWNYIVSIQSLGKTFQGHEYGVFIYDKSRNIEILQDCQLSSSNDSKSFTRNPFFINLKVQSTSYLLVSIHLKAVNFVDKVKSKYELVDEINDLSILTEALKHSLKPGHNVILLGDFNETATNECFQCLRKEEYMFCVDTIVPTNTSKKAEKFYDNMWINETCRKFYTGNSGVIKEGLTHPHIPKPYLKGWGDYVSDHCPIWADFFVHI